TERASHDGTRAELSYDRTGDGFTASFHDLQLEIFEHGQRVFSHRLRDAAPAGYGSSRSVHVRDLNGGRPEVLVDLDTGGGYCCWMTVVEHRTAGGYRRSAHSWGPKRARLTNLGGGRLLEFVAHDDRLLSPYGCNFCWRFLPHVWQFGHDGRFRDVTARFPRQVRPGARTLRHRYFHASGHHKDVKAILAGYIAA